MSDLIDRNSLLRSLEKFAPEKHDALVEMLIKKEPTVDAVPVEWIKKYMSRCLAIEQDAIGEMVKEWAEREEE